MSNVVSFHGSATVLIARELFQAREKWGETLELKGLRARWGRTLTDADTLKEARQLKRMGSVPSWAVHVRDERPYASDLRQAGKGDGALLPVDGIDDEDRRRATRRLWRSERKPTFLSVVDSCGLLDDAELLG